MHVFVKSIATDAWKEVKQFKKQPILLAKTVSVCLIYLIFVVIGVVVSTRHAYNVLPADFNCFFVFFLIFGFYLLSVKFDDKEKTSGSI